MNVRQHHHKVRHWREDGEDQSVVIKPPILPANILAFYQLRSSTFQTLTDSCFPQHSVRLEADRINTLTNGRNGSVQTVRHERKRCLLAFVRRGWQKELGRGTHAYNYARWLSSQAVPKGFTAVVEGCCSRGRWHAKGVRRVVR